MVEKEPVGELDPRFSSEGATAIEWAQAREHLVDAEVYWLSTVRPEGRPHVTPLLALWHDDMLYFCTGPTERKARNLAANAHCVLTTGSNMLNKGLDLVVEGEAVQVDDDGRLRRIAAAYESKYGSDWHFEVRDGVFHNAAGGTALVYEVAPTTIFGFAKGEYGQTRWRFSA
ncbi:pyridoxamine 5'-phosphate oxidase family protein [Micromonospora sonneratiae]|uniref:Pyridoxamine 5'-phosphate oxidase family protein n=1 Tax=Micromonospora sonneratiae TaxID=1184706 RepID=A0ABW3YCH9_9ACTN